MEEDQTVEDGEGRVIEEPREDNVLEIEKAVGIVDLSANVWVVDFDDFLEFGRVREVLSVVCAM